MEKVVCIYHSNCFDGIAAAWVISKQFPDAEFIPANYGDTKLINNIQQDCYENANINYHYIIVDFSFPRELMIQMWNKAESMIVLDHHKTAQKDCEGLEFCQFDMNESGASLAWKYLFTNAPIPNLIRYIKDRDLWLFKENQSNEINAYIQSFDMNIETYNKLYEILENNLIMPYEAGSAIVRYKERLTKQICQTARPMEIQGHIVLVANSPVLMSEVGHELALQNRGPFGAYYFDRSDGIRQWGARSIGDFDVSEIAKKFGGGGHKNAAGWQEVIK